MQVLKTYYNRDNKVKQITLIWTCRENGRKWNSQKVLYMNLGTRLKGRPRNRWQDEVREDGRTVGGEGQQEEVHNREQWKKHQRTARNQRILHIPMESVYIIYTPTCFDISMSSSGSSIFVPCQVT